MNWQQVCDDPALKDLPYKIELNEWGNIVMSPASNVRAAFQVEISSELKKQVLNGRVLSECSVSTSKGVKVADVAWCSKNFIDSHAFETPYSRSPEVCVEILSPSNREAEMTEKMKLYFEKGAQECWLCSEMGDISFYTEKGNISKSQLLPQFPNKITVK